MPWTRLSPASPTASRSTHFKDGSLQVIDNGRGMPVDTHPEEKVSGAEVIMTRLHAGAKFGTKNYQFSGGLHGVGVSVVNALSAKLDVEIRRNGLVYQMSFRDGIKSSELKTIGKAPKSDTGTTGPVLAERHAILKPRNFP